MTKPLKMMCSPHPCPCPCLRLSLALSGQTERTGDGLGGFGAVILRFEAA